VGEGGELFHEDRQADMTKLTEFFSFQTAPKNVAKVKFIVQRITAERDLNFHISGN
jgi:hypothetical protein